jgi:protein disulfide-isomerase-like protein
VPWAALKWTYCIVNVRCGHCKHLKPEYAELASSFADDKSVVIAAMDATAAEVPSGFSVEGYPTLYFVPATTKKPVSYEGDRSAAAMEEYIRKHKTF